MTLPELPFLQPHPFPGPRTIVETSRGVAVKDRTVPQWRGFFTYSDPSHNVGHHGLYLDPNDPFQRAIEGRTAARLKQRK